jgi:hypothetical protein
MLGGSGKRGYEFMGGYLDTADVVEGDGVADTVGRVVEWPREEREASYTYADHHVGGRTPFQRPKGPSEGSTMRDYSECPSLASDIEGG